jgi:hypothetical protein
VDTDKEERTAWDNATPAPSVDDVLVAETENAGVSGTPHAEDVKDLGFTGSYLTKFEIRK